MAPDGENVGLALHAVWVSIEDLHPGGYTGRRAGERDMALSLNVLSRLFTMILDPDLGLGLGRGPTAGASL